MTDKLIRFGLFVLFAGLLAYFGLVQTEPEFYIDPIYGTKIDNDTFYWVLRPFTFLDLLGLILLNTAAFTILGAWKLFFGEQFVTKEFAKRLYTGAVAAGILSVFLIYAN